ncbi:MAG: extracellular solute-binding protein [Eubacteriales bacterium]|nr:extracellular solute-binding protein [Eubacteriales bacterium]
MLKRIVGLVCCAALVMSFSVGALAAGTYRMAGFDGDESSHVWKDNNFFARMQARTGIAFTFDEYTNFDKWQAAKETMFTTGTLPDVLFKAELTTREQIAYADAGMLIDLKPLLMENAPNLWALLEAHPDWLKAITLPDGKIVALPSLNELPSQNAMWINRTWLDKLGMAAPTDWDGLVQVLTAFKTGDPNGNGKADEIPLAFLGPWDLKFLGHAVGLIANDYNIYLDESGTVRFMPQEDAYFDLLGKLAALNAAGLMDPDGFSTADSLRIVTDSEAVTTYGVMFGPNPMNLLPYTLGAQYELLEPLQYNGKQIYRDLNGSVLRGSFAITSACDDPAALLRWVDVLYSTDGAIEAMAGQENVDYTINDDGTWAYANADSASSYILYDLSLYDTGTMPWLFPLSFYDRYDNDDIRVVDQALETLQTLLVQPFPTSYTLTLAQEDQIAPLQKMLGIYVDESLARFVLGEWDVNDASAQAAYREGLTQNGLDAFLAFWQGIADAQ